MRVAWLEWLFVLGLGLPLAVVLNHHLDSGIDITRDYFPDSIPQSPAASKIQPADFQAEVREAISRLERKGFSALSMDQVWFLLGSEEWKTEQIVLIDARNEAAYAAGHLPLAYRFDHYHPEEHLDEVLAACLVASQIIVYCNGGQCEDSEFAAAYLRDMGIETSKMAVLAEGMHGWLLAGHPVVLGDRQDDLIEWETILGNIELEVVQP